MSVPRTFLKYFVILCVVSAGAVQSASAQEEEQAAPRVLEEIIVTATKREESAQDVSISITTITADTMQKFGVRDFNDYINLIPGLSTSQRSAASELGPREIGLRGIQTISGAFLVGQNTVGFYIDETPITMSNPRLVDLDHIEVLRGPQGTLYGAASLAGTIKLVTKKPDFERFDGHVMANMSTTEFGGENYDLEAMVNLPIGNRAALRVSGYFEENAGFIDLHEIDLFANPTGRVIKEDSNGENVTGGRIALTLLPTDKTSVTLAVMYDKTEQDTTNYFHPKSPGDVGTLSKIPGTDFTYRDLGIGAPYIAALDGDRDDYDDPLLFGRALDPIFTEFTLTTFSFDWQLTDDFEVVSSTSYYEDEMTMIIDVTEGFGILVSDAMGNPSPVYIPGHYSPDNEEVTHESRLQTTWDKRSNFTLGVFYTNRRENYNTRFFAGLNTTVAFPVVGVLPNSPDGYIFWSTSFRDRDEIAIFGQYSYDFTDQLRIVLGARAFRHEFELWDHFRGNPLFIQGGDNQLTGGNKDEDVVPNLKFEYRPFDDTLVYVAAAEGFRMGGANFPLPDSPACRADVESQIGSPRTPEQYLSDSLWSYELGWKQSFLESRVNTAVSLFYMDWEDTQVGVNPLCGLSGSVINVGSVKSQGVEFEITALVSDKLVVAMNLSYIDAQINEDYFPEGRDPALGSLALKGQQMPDVPKWTGSIMADYSRPINADTELFIRSDYSYRSRQVGSSFAAAGGSGWQDGYGELNLRLGVNWNQWEFSLFGENLTGELPSTIGKPSPFSFVGFRENDVTLRPFTWGVSVRRTLGSG